MDGPKINDIYWLSMAVKSCCIENCKSSTLRKEDEGVTYHKFPNDRKLKLAWLKSTKVVRNGELTLYVCSRHFCKHDYKLYMETKYMLKSDAVPSIFPWTMEADIEEPLITDIKMEPDNLLTNPEVFGEFESTINDSEQIGTSNNTCDPPTISFSSNNFDLNSIRDYDEKGQSTMTLSVGSKAEAKDFTGKWYSVEICEVDYDEMEVLVRYDDLKKHDEWIYVNSPRLRPYTEKPKIALTPVHSPSVDSGQMPPDKSKLKFEVGERCLAKWNNNGKFAATIHRELDNDQYEVMFDDGVLSICKLAKLFKLRPNIGEPEPQPSTSSTKFVLTSPSKSHRHLFDPLRDYLGTKSERREKKRKLNIKSLFNIGQRKQSFSGDHKKKRRIIRREKNVISDKRNVRSQGDLNLDNDEEMQERSLSPICEPESYSSVNHAEKLSNLREVISKLENSLIQKDFELPVSPVKMVQVKLVKVEPGGPKTEEPAEVKTEESNSKEVIPEELKLKEDKPKEIKTEIVEPEEFKSEEIKPEEVKTEEATNGKGEVSAKVEANNSAIVNEIKKEPIKLVISLPQDMKFKKMSKIKSAKKLRMLRDKKVKKELLQVSSELEEIKRQVMEMKQAKLKKVSPTSNPVNKYTGQGANDQSYLLPGEWCCKWVDNQPEGVVYEHERIDNLKTLQRLSIQVFDKRLPEGWIKLLVRRSIGTSAGKWDVAFVCPDGRKIHTKSEMRSYLELQNDPELKPYEYALLDFGVHRKLSRRLGWDDEIPVMPVIPISKKKSCPEQGRRQRLCAIPVTIETTINTPGLNENNLVPPPFDNSTWEEGYVYVGSLRTEVINNMLRCPAQGCFKNFRTNILLQMHIKYYHKELIALMGSTPNVLDLASARTASDQVVVDSKAKSKKPKLNKSTDGEDALQRDAGYHRHEVEKTPTPECSKLRKALVAKRKRPKVLLPVRKVEPAEVEPEYSFKEEFHRKFGSPAECLQELDFETEISAHTVSKIISDRKKIDKLSRGGVSTASEEEDFGSDTLSGPPRSNSPEGKMEDGLQDRPKEGELYYTSETGERIKIVHMKREEIINCHCEFKEEDGLMIQCELCLCWQHALCHNIQKESEVPEKYTCSICLNPRRGRRSRRFVHDQDRLYEGLLPGAAPCQNLRRAHELSGNLLRIRDALHALRVQRFVATKKNHPKLYLWAADWEKPDALADDTKYDLHGILKDNLADIRLHGEDDKALLHRSDGSNSLANLLGSPTTPFDLPITTELERLAKSIQEVEPIRAPVPEAAIQDSACKKRLLLHVQRCHALIDAKLDSIEAQVAELESQDPSLDGDETAEFCPRTKQTIQMLSRDLDTMEELDVIT